MAEEENKQAEEQEASEIVAAGQTSSWLTENGFDNEALAPDTSDVEMNGLAVQGVCFHCTQSLSFLPLPVAEYY